jgi:hypothetical protein
MGSCCSSKAAVEEKVNSNPSKKSLPKMKSSINKEEEKHDFLISINAVVDKYKNSKFNIEIKKYSACQLFNLFKHFPFLKSSDHILLDLTNEDRFHNVDYKISNVNDIINTSKYDEDPSALEVFKKFVDLKTILVISGNKNLKQFEKCVQFFVVKSLRASFRVFDQDIPQFSTKLDKSLFSLIESKNVNSYPYCLVSYNKFSSVLSNGFFFVDITAKPFNKEIFFSKEEDSNAFMFFQEFNLNFVCEVLNQKNEKQKDEKNSTK